MRSSPPDRRHRIYEHPRLYDLAFSFRDIKDECDGVLALARLHGRGEPRRVLELACGPGHHLREFARRGLDAIGIDLSADMIGYARSLRAADGVDVTLRRGDMRRFRVAPPVDVALCLFDSFTHCTTDADAVAALRSAARALRPGGVYVIELSHPADYFGIAPSRTLDRWTQRRPDVVVEARYATSDRDAAAETYVATMTVRATYRDGSAPRRIVSRQLHRMWMRSAIENVAARSRAFDVAGLYGDLSTRIPFSMDPESWRMVAVLRRRPDRSAPA